MESINFLLLSTFAAGARECGLNLNAVLQELGIDIDMSARPQGRMSLGVFKTLFDACIQKSTRSYFPLATGGVFNFEGLPELGAFVNSSPTLRESFKVFHWSPQLIHPNLYFELDFREPGASLFLEVRDPQLIHQDLPSMVEMSCAAIVNLCARMLPGDPMIQRVEFKHPPQTSPAIYEEFLKVPVAFSCPRNRIEVDLKYADKPLPGGIPSAHIKAEQLIVGKLLSAPVYGPLSQKLTLLLRSKLSLLGEPFEVLAAQLDLQPRTLQRRLKLEGTSFADIQARTRHELACEMLRGSVLDIESISIKLGYSDRRSFTNAFVKWQGQSPREYRTSLEAGSGGSPLKS